MVTVKDLARMCGVSPSTVSNILNGKNNVSEATRQRVLKAVEETHYQPNYFASSIRRQNSKMVSIIVEDLYIFSTLPMVVTMMSRLEDLGYRAILINLRMYGRWSDTWFEDEDKVRSVLYPALKEAQSIRVDGIIYVAGHGRNIRNFPSDYEVPTVVTYATAEGTGFPSVILDDLTGGYRMTDYLLGKGHRRIAILCGSQGNIHAERRLDGYRKCLRDRELEFDPDMIFCGDWQRSSGYEACPEIMKKKPTAIWAMNDQMTGGIYDYLIEHGYRIGEDISVAGYDGAEFSEYMHPSLTTMRLPLREIGSVSANTLVKMIETPGWKPSTMEIPMAPTLIEGCSVKEMNASSEPGYF